mgnify:CR=1 FL=1
MLRSALTPNAIHAESQAHAEQPNPTHAADAPAGSLKLRTQKRTKIRSQTQRASLV